jgi:hypothetical protein
VGCNYGLCSVTEAEFAQDVADVGLDGFVAEYESIGDLLVRESSCDQAQDLEFAARE